MRIRDRLNNRKKVLKELFEKNAKSISSYNASILSLLILVGIIAILIPIMSIPFSESKSRLIPAYLLSVALFILAFWLFQRKPFKKRPLLGVYLVFFGAFVFAIYLSIVNSQEQRATIILGLFCIFPMCIIDKPYKIKLFSAAFYLVHTVLAFIFKGSTLGVDDAVNCFCFLTLSNIIGDRLIKIRVEAFEAKRQLILEKETDELTGLKNRRKLFQMLGEYDMNDSSAPSGVIMIDIDDFKAYNDQFGHVAGDQLLNRFGEILLSYEKMFKLQFFRYGGEEFVGLAWGYKLLELQSILETIKVSVNSMPDFHQEVRVSIGIADCETKSFSSYEKYIELADKALYKAKTEGKNRVVCYDEAIDSDVRDIKDTLPESLKT